MRSRTPTDPLLKRFFHVFAIALVVVTAGMGDSDAATRKKKQATLRPAASAPRPEPPRVDAHAVARDIAPVTADFARWVDQLEQGGKVAGLAVAVVKDDKVLYERGIGLADWNTREPVTATTVFRLASLSKAFATTLTGLLVDDGMLAWETRVSGVLPTFALADVDGSAKLTVRDILSHRVGLPHNTYDHLIEQDEPYPLLVDRLREVPLTCAVGDCYGYQNIAFSLIGDVTYAITGDFFYHLVEKRLFHPLGMSTATYGRDALEGSAQWARPHRRAGKAWKSFQPNETYYHMPPAAGVNASLRDMQQWLIAQMGGRPDVLPANLLAELQAPLVRTPKDITSTPWRRGRLLDANYALGWRVFDYSGEPLVFHAGAVQGYRAVIGFLPKHRLGIVMLWNCESPAPNGLLPMLFDRYLGLPQTDWAGIGAVDEEAAATGG
jgi:beta-lactamase class C